MGMANVLNDEKKQQVLALGRLGWSLRRIQQATHVRRETASTYLKAVGIAVRPPSGWGRHEAKPANEVITDSGAAKLAIPVIPDPLDPNVNCNPNSENLSNEGRSTTASKTLPLCFDADACSCANVSPVWEFTAFRPTPCSASTFWMSIFLREGMKPIFSLSAHWRRGSIS